MDDSMLLDHTLSELLDLHRQERLLMQELRHQEHEVCIEKKLAAALAAESLASRLPSGPSAKSQQLLLLIRDAAQVNASIAAMMLSRYKEKLDYIRQISSTNYEKNGQMSQLALKGGLFSGKT